MTEFVTKILDLARTATGMELAWVSRFVDDRQVFEFVDGDQARFGLVNGDSGELCDSYCGRVVTGDLPRNVPDARQHPITSRLSVTSTLNIGSYVGTPIFDDTGQAVGMLCAISDHARSDLPPEVLQQLEMLAGIVGLELRRVVDDAEHHSEQANRVEQWLRGDGFEIHLQPIVELHDPSRPIGFEVLSRFGPGHANPAECFAQAWAVGKGPDLELAAIATAAVRLNQLPDHVYVSFNASPHPDVLRRVPTVVPDHLMGRIVIELTEHTEIRDYDEVTAALVEMRSAGARLAVDDAGAGYASFRHVLQLRPDFIKLDMSLTRNIHDDPVKQALANSWAGLANSLDARIIAEGVESVDERDALTRIGIHAAQGYLFARPAPLEQLWSQGALGDDWRLPALTAS